MKNALIFSSCLVLTFLGLFLYLKKDQLIPAVEDMAPATLKKDDVPTLHVSFLDIGQGDATFITFPNGRQMLLDCAIDARIIEAMGRVMPFYDKSIDYLVVSHPDLDHYGGCVDVLRRFDVGEIVYNGLKKEGDDFYVAFWKSVGDEGVKITTITAADAWTIASTTIHFLYPDHSIEQSSKIPGTTKQAEANNTSIVMKLSFGEADILLTADAELEEEEYLLNTYSNQLDVEVLKAGHHGSNSSSIVPFIDMVSPLHTIFSSGKENKYGHPSRRVIRRIERAGSLVWRTDELGDILLSTTGEYIMINGETYGVEQAATGTTFGGSTSTDPNKK